MKVRVLCFIGLLLISSVGVGGVAKTKVDSKLKANKVEVTDPQKPIIVKRAKPEFTIFLKANPTTGFLWFLKGYDPELLKPVRQRFYPPKNSKRLVGSPGYDRWVFRVKPAGFIVPQITNITLIYTRPWDEQGAQVVNFKVVLQ